HGMGKLPVSDKFVEGVGSMGFPVPVVFAWAAALSESVGGILLALGWFTRPAAAMIVATMTTAVVLRHAGDPFGNRELPLLFGTVALMFLLAGPGKYSVDGRRGDG
ncbi:MAG: DoxX family protein, partial [Gemmatimonadetes bacterium]|nr:DoxX family protein [Gemmatimonadota bacterium]